ncbi:UNVERIFIED_CONTAM: hypothetical protein B566_EDAN019478 [Ephemera danica]|nr:hypothetical protein B566_EDAN019478 [Ephemera danica]
MPFFLFLLDSPMLTGVEERLCGAIALTCNPKDGFGEFLWAHSTKTFILGHMEVHSKPKLIISSLPLGQSPGKGLVGGGSQFILPAVAQVDSMESSVLDYTVTLVKEMDPMCSQNSHLI